MRSRSFRTRTHNRYWWYRLRDTDYVPPIFAGLSEAEWAIMDAWFEDTEAKFASPGELSVPGLSFLSGLIGGNGISSIVQCGHYVGYSTLLLGFLLRRMGKKNALFSIDIDQSATDYTQAWVARAGLQEQVTLRVTTSSNPELPNQAQEYFGRPAQLVFIDSSHQYAHTLEELDLWYDALPSSGLLMMHDVSTYAQAFDATKSGGVLRATREWAERRKLNPFLMNAFVDGSQQLDAMTYKDGCGMGLLQKP